MIQKVILKNIYVPSGVKYISPYAFNYGNVFIDEEQIPSEWDPLFCSPYGSSGVKFFSKAYLNGAHTIDGFACAAKHFPGNGLDFRDAHLSNNINDFSLEKWMETYGHVYKTLIEEDVKDLEALGNEECPVVSTFVTGV